MTDTQDNANGIWQLEAEGSEVDMFTVAETLGFLEISDALSLSLFESAQCHRVEAGYATEEDARDAASALPFPTTLRYLPPKDWVSEVQANLAPVRAGRFTLHGSHDRTTARGDILIEVEAGPAFGSGHHPTTRGCLEVFSQLLDDGLTPESVLDVGCGTGVLAIAAALTLNADITATDIDADAVTVTQETAELNDATLTTFQADGLDDPRLSGPYALIFANILAGPLKTLAAPIEKAAQLGGLIILSGLLDEQADEVSAAYTGPETGLRLREVRRQPLEGWTTLLLQKPA